MGEAGPSVVHSIRASSKRLDDHALRAEVRHHLDASFGDWDGLHAGPHAPQGSSRPSSAHGKGKRKRSLKEELAYWEAKEAATAKELEETSAILPKLLEETQEKLQSFLSEAQGLSLQRYALADKLANLVSELSSDQHDADGALGEQTERGQTVLEQMQVLQAELQRLEAGLAWVTVLERVLTLSERVLDARGHHPSPLAALPQFWDLHALAAHMQQTLPDGTALLATIVEVRDETWNGLKEIMTKNLLHACEPLKWPLKTDYGSLSPVQRRSFERAFQDLLYLQLEGEKLGDTNARPPHWSSGTGLYPLQAMIAPIELRFKYHFQGTKSTNRVDKPEWAFSNILDQIYQHQAFIDEYLQPLVTRAGFRNIDVKSEFTMLLFPILLNLLRSRIPPMLEHPALLAHTIYQTVIFDDAIREGGFDVDAVSVNEGVAGSPWKGLAGVLLKENDWFEQWLTAERKFADVQLNEIITSSEAWTIETDISEEEQKIMHGLRPTSSARRVKSLLEQIQDRYAPLPDLEYKLPFLTTIQLPLLSSYHGRIDASLEAFETLSSAFVRAVPGALANSRAGINYDLTRLTGGATGLQRLLKALLSARWLLAALQIWADELFYVEISTEVQNTPSMRWKLQGDPLVPAAIHTAGPPASIFDVLIERFEGLASRAEEMAVRLISVEVENDLREHLKRRWDQTASDESDQSHDASLVAGLTTFSSLLGELRVLPSLDTSRVYRKVVQHLTNHISQRCVYAGWSKFSVKGGKDFVGELSDWRHAATTALIGVGANGIPTNLVDAPWDGLMDIGKLLSLPMDAQDKQSDVTFGEAMAAAWGGEESLREFLSRVGIKLSREDLQAVLRRRVECWR